MSFDPEQVDREELLRTIRELDFEPELVEPPPPTATEARARVDVAELPGELQELFLRARKDDRPVLLDFTAPG